VCSGSVLYAVILLRASACPNASRAALQCANPGLPRWRMKRGSKAVAASCAAKEVTTAAPLRAKSRAAVSLRFVVVSEKLSVSKLGETLVESSTRKLE